jgi:regulator of protease activity HflC (stomatin/prohibitin superfamily)
MGCCVSVSEAEVGVLERWGKFENELQPGLHFFNPISSSMVATVPLAVRIIEVLVETKTRENTFCRIKLSIHFRADPNEVRQFYYVVSARKTQLESFVHNIIRATVPGMSLDDLFISNGKLAKQVLEELNDKVGPTGAIVTDVLIIDIEPDAAVKQAMNNINAAERNRVAAVATAEAAKITTVKKAEAEAEATHLRGQGVANARRAIADGLHDSIKQFDGTGLSADSVTGMIMLGQYFDTLKEVSGHSGTNTIFLPHSPGGMNDVTSQMREGILTSKIPTGASNKVATKASSSNQ